MSYFPEAVPSESATDRAWFRRRPVRMALAGLAACGIAVGGILVHASASATGEQALLLAASTPHQVVQQALDTLANGPMSVTVSEDGSADSFTVTSTPEGAGFAFTGGGTSVNAALVDERLYLKVKAKGSDELRTNPMASLVLAGHPSIGALLNGRWVSVDVSPDSPVLAALKEAQAGPHAQADAQADQAAAEQLGEAIRSIGHELAEPLRQAVTDHATVTEVQDTPAPADGSQRYRVEVPLAAVRADVSDELQAAATDFLNAWDEFVADAGSELTAMTANLGDVHDRVESALDKGLSEDLEHVTADVYLAGEKVTRIEVSDTTLTFAADPSLAEVDGATSMDDDLVALLPLLSSLGAMGAGPDGAALPGLALAPRA